MLHTFESKTKVSCYMYICLKENKSIMLHNNYMFESKTRVSCYTRLKVKQKYHVTCTYVWKKTKVSLHSCKKTTLKYNVTHIWNS